MSESPRAIRIFIKMLSNTTPRKSTAKHLVYICYYRGFARWEKAKYKEM